MNIDHLDFTAKELRKLRSLKDPHRIQQFVDAMPYHLADTAWSPRRVLREGTAHCLEGAIAKSNYSGCRYREPVYRSLRELAVSYFEGYFNLRRERSLRTFSRPVNLSRFDRLDWMTTEEPVWFIAEYLFTITHFRLLKPGMEKRLHRLDDRSFLAGCLGRAKKPLRVRPAAVRNRSLQPCCWYKPW